MLKLISKTVFIICFILTNSANAGLVAHFKFDGNLLDTSGNGYSAGDGSLTGDTHYVPGKYGQALDFDGNGDYIQVMVAPDGQPQTVDGQKAMTVAMWVKMNHYPTSQTDLLASREWYYGDVNLEFHSSFGLDTVFFINVQGVIPDENPLGTIPEKKLGEWVHIAATYDAVAGEAYIYIDGVPGDAAAVDPSRECDIGNYTLGGNAQPLYNNRWFDGQIDEVRIYDQALTPAEVQVIYHEFDDITEQCNSPGDIPGDLNLDCDVNLKDLAIIARDWLKCTNPEDYRCQTQ